MTRVAVPLDTLPLAVLLAAWTRLDGDARRWREAAIAQATVEAAILRRMGASGARGSEYRRDQTAGASDGAASRLLED